MRNWNFIFLFFFCLFFVSQLFSKIIPVGCQVDLDLLNWNNVKSMHRWDFFYKFNWLHFSSSFIFFYFFKIEHSLLTTSLDLGRWNFHQWVHPKSKIILKLNHQWKVYDSSKWKFCKLGRFCMRGTVTSGLPNLILTQLPDYSYILIYLPFSILGGAMKARHFIKIQILMLK